MKMERKVKLKTINQFITCFICKGYLIDSTTITECLHTFCKSCIVKYLEEKNTCPKCQIEIHQSYPLNYISFDRTMQDIVYKLVPKIQEKESKQVEEFYKKKGLPIPTQSEGDTQPECRCDPPVPPPAQDEDYHRSDEQVNICLECKNANLKSLKRRYLRVSSQATITHLKKFVSFKIYNNMTRFKEVDILCNEEILGKDHTLKFVAITRWRSRETPLLLHYRQRVTGL